MMCYSIDIFMSIFFIVFYEIMIKIINICHNNKDYEIYSVRFLCFIKFMTSKLIFFVRNNQI
jgi:hypothetical protein